MDRLNEEANDGMLGAEKREEHRPGTPAGSAQGGVESVEHRSPQTGEISNSQAADAVEGEPRDRPTRGTPR